MVMVEGIEPPSVAGSTLVLVSPAPTEGASPLRIPRSWVRYSHVMEVSGVSEGWYGGGGGYRTPDPRLMSPLLYQLSYTATRRTMYQGVRLDVKAI